MSKRLYQIEQIMESFHSIKQSFAAGLAMPDKKHITPAQGFVLHFIIKHKRSSVKEIAKSFSISSSAATQLIDALVKNGLLEKKQDPDDRRFSILSLSAKAQKQFANMKERGLGKMKNVFSSLSDEELETYTELTKKIADNLKK